MTLSAAEFMRRFLLHVLPSGFHRIRHYGLLANPNRKKNIDTARALLQARRRQRRSNPTPQHRKRLQTRPRSCAGTAARRCSSSRPSPALRTSADHPPRALHHERARSPCPTVTAHFSLLRRRERPWPLGQNSASGLDHRNTPTRSASPPQQAHRRLSGARAHRTDPTTTPHCMPSNPHSSAPLTNPRPYPFAVSSLEDCPTPTRQTHRVRIDLRIGVGVEQSLTKADIQFIELVSLNRSFLDRRTRPGLQPAEA